MPPENRLIKKMKALEEIQKFHAWIDKIFPKKPSRESFSTDDVQTGFVVFLDLLGSKLPKQCTKDDIMNNANILLKFYNESKSEDRGNKESPKVIAFSDSVIVLYPNVSLTTNEEDEQYQCEWLPNIISFLTDLQCYLLIKKDIIMRGGIAYGNFIYDDKLMLLTGDAYENAYIQESKNTKVPVISLHQTAKDEFENCFHNIDEMRLLDDGNGLVYLHYLVSLNSWQEWEGVSISKMLEKHKSIIFNNILNNSSAKDKYDFLKNYHNETIDRNDLDINLKIP